MESGAKGEIHALKCDISKEEDILNAVKWTRDNLGGADVLVNNAGVLHNSPLLSKKIKCISPNVHSPNHTIFFKSAAPTEEFRHVLEVNVLALCAFTREVIKDMRDRKVDDGHVVHINRCCTIISTSVLSAYLAI